MDYHHRLVRTAQDQDAAVGETVGRANVAAIEDRAAEVRSAREGESG